MDHADEQRQELQALLAIYQDDIVVENESQPIQVALLLSNQLDNGDARVECKLRIQMPANYPDQAPVVSLQWSDNVDHDWRCRADTLVADTAATLLGTQMVFGIVSDLQLFMEDVSNDIVARADKSRQQEDSQRHRGRPMTHEEFLQWKCRFDAEMAKNAKPVVPSSVDVGHRLTGREQFLRDRSLVTSDVCMLAENGEEMVIDQSLFDDDEDEEQGE